MFYGPVVRARVFCANLYVCVFEFIKKRFEMVVKFIERIHILRLGNDMGLGGSGREIEKSIRKATFN